jgi:hypothetical protein
MSNNLKSIIENIYNDKFNTLKEDLAIVMSKKAVDVLENKKVDVAKKYFNAK